VPDEPETTQHHCARCRAEIDMSLPHCVIARNIESTDDLINFEVHDALVLAALCPDCAKVTTFQLVDVPTAATVAQAEVTVADLDGDRYRWGSDRV
jgi:hypothetical protein